MDLLALIDDPKMRTLLIAAATIAAVFVLLRIMRGLARGDTGSASRRSSGRPQRFGEAAARDSFSEVPRTFPRHQGPDRSPALDDWEVRMHETARELIGRIDAKLAALQALTLEADRAAARLEQALAAASRIDSPAASGCDAVSPDAAAARPGGQLRPTSASTDALSELAPEKRELDAPRADQADALRTAGDRCGLDLSSMPPSESRRHEEIYLLADYGFDPAEIAHRTGMPIGEVELILRLREAS